MSKQVLSRDNIKAMRDEPYATLWEMAGHKTGLAKLGAAYFVVDARSTSPRHWHSVTEEIYAIVSGAGVMHIGEQDVVVGAGDCISIIPGMVHALSNPGPDPLVMWVMTSPPYNADDDIEVAQP